MFDEVRDTKKRFGNLPESKYKSHFIKRQKEECAGKGSKTFSASYILLSESAAQTWPAQGSLIRARKGKNGGHSWIKSSTQTRTCLPCVYVHSRRFLLALCGIDSPGNPPGNMLKLPKCGPDPLFMTLMLFCSVLFPLFPILLGRFLEMLYSLHSFLMTLIFSSCLPLPARLPIRHKYAGSCPFL